MTMKVKPNPARTVEGQPLRVLDPAKAEFIPVGGANVPTTPYWLRRLADGDVVRVTDDAGDTGENSHAHVAAEVPQNGPGNAGAKAAKPTRKTKPKATEA